MPFTPILATLGYVLSPDGRQVLLVHRNKRPDDPHYGKYNGLGGKLHAGEDVVAFVDLNARWMVPMHYGTFRLSHEPMDEPLQLLDHAARQAGVQDRVLVLKEGVTRVF